MPKLFGLEDAGDVELTDGMYHLRLLFFSAPSLVMPIANGQTALTIIENRLIPLRNHGIQTMSIGYLTRKLSCITSATITPLPKLRGLADCT